MEEREESDPNIKTRIRWKKHYPKININSKYYSNIKKQPTSIKKRTNNSYT